MEGLRASEGRLPAILSGAGVLFGLLVPFELAVAAHYGTPLVEGFWIGVATNLPFLTGLVYGGYWLADSGLSPSRYRRIGGWIVGVGLVLTPLMVSLTVMLLPEAAVSTHQMIGTIRWDGSFSAVIGLAIGIYEAQAIERREIVEQLEARTAALERERDRLERFADIVSHDLRNPLNIAEGRMGLLQEEYDSEHIDAVNAAHDRMNNIIEDTLLLAREGKTVDETERVDLKELAERAWGVVETGGATLDIETGMEVEADADRLRHVFENLFRNSVEHGSTGSRPQADDSVEHGSPESTETDTELTVRVGPLADGSGFYIEDTGSGIPESDREAVFDDGFTTADEGTGFGLSILEEIVTAHGWETAVDESAEGGARFEITGVDSLQQGTDRDPIPADG